MLAGLLALLVGLIAGVIAHELAHAAALRAFAVPYTLEWLPGREEGRLLGLDGWAAVTPHANANTAPWQLRIAAVTPLGLALPGLPIVLGVVPDPLAAGSLPLALGVVGYLACAIPSPADFSVFWHPRQSIQRSV